MIKLAQSLNNLVLKNFSLRTKQRATKIYPKAFSLIELSVVITLFAMIVAANLSLSTTSANNNKIKITNDRIREIYKAMGVYLFKYKRLPCVAPLNVAKTDPAYGTAVSPCNSSSPGYFTTSGSDGKVKYGMVPVKTLELPNDMAEDGFGSKFSYAMIDGFANDAIGKVSGTRLSEYSNNRIKIHKKIGSATPIAIESDAMFVIISHGPNKYGAWNALLTEQNIASPLTEETWNYATNNSTLYNYDPGSSKYPFIAAYDNKNFDDILFYKSRIQIALDFDLYFLFSCTDYTNYSNYPEYYTWSRDDGSTGYGEAVPSNDPCTNHSSGPYYAIKRCGVFGNWDSDLVYYCVP